MDRKALLEAKSLEEFQRIARAGGIAFADLAPEEGRHLNRLLGVATTVPEDQDIAYTGKDGIKRK